MSDISSNLVPNIFGEMCPHPDNMHETDTTKWQDGFPSVTSLGRALLDYIAEHDPDWIKEAQKEIETNFYKNTIGITSSGGDMSRYIGKIFIKRWGHDAGKFFLDAAVFDGKSDYNVIRLVAGHGPTYDWCFLYDDELPQTLAIAQRHALSQAVGKPLSQFIDIKGLTIDPTVLETSDPRDSLEEDDDSVDDGIWLHLETTVEPWQHLFPKDTSAKTNPKDEKT